MSSTVYNTNTNPMVFARILTNKELVDMASRTEAGDLLVDGQWFTAEMERLMPIHRIISIQPEDDYYVWSAPSNDEFRIQRSWCTEISDKEALEIDPALVHKMPVGGIAYTPESLKEISAEEAAERDRLIEEQRKEQERAAAEAREAQRIQDEERARVEANTVRILEEAPKTYSKKKTAANKLPIEVGDIILVAGETIPLRVESVDADTVQANGKSFDIGKAHPFYEVNTSVQRTDIKLNDLIRCNYKSVEYYVLCTNAETIEVLQKQGAISINNIYRNTDTSAKCFDRASLKHYSSGEYIDKATGKALKGKALGTILESRFAPNIEEVAGSFELELIAKHYGIKPEDVKPKEVKILKAVEILLDSPECIKDSEWVMLIGPSGSGKTSVAVEYAESKNLDYVKMPGSAQLTVDDLLGYNSITTGEYFPSLLRDAIENGKVFILDEIDACNPNTLLCLNAFKMKEVQFPDKKVKVHEDFRFIATANTLMYSEDYNGRSAMDRATIKRFSVLFYDLTGAELALRYGFEDTKDLKITDKKAYNTSEYQLRHGVLLEPKGDLDPRDVQRIVRTRKMEKDGLFNF